MKVLQIITGLAPGGAERLLLDMTSRFDRDRFEVRVATMVNELSALAIYGHENIPVDVFEFRGNRKISALRQMRALVRSFAPDLIHAHMFHGLIGAFAVSRFRAEPPALCFTSHLNAYPSGRRLVVQALKRWRAADIIFTDGQHPAMNASCTEVIPNGVPVASQPHSRQPWNPASPVRLLAVGRLADQKDPLGLLRAFAKAGLPNAVLTFIGAGPLEDDARQLAKQLGLSTHVKFLGTRQDVRDLMREADIFVMHSKYEGMPMALLEAGAEAMPCIVTPVGSIPDVIGHDRGWLAASDHFAETLCRVVSEPAAAIEAGRRLHRHVLHNHSLEQTTRQHESLYRRIMQRVAPDTYRKISAGYISEVAAE